MTTLELTVNSNGVAQYVRVSGDPSSGETLIAIHGGPGMTSDYMLNLEKLAGPDLAVVSYDQRGIGRSSSPQAEPGNYTLNQYTEDLRRCGCPPAPQRVGRSVSRPDSQPL